MDIFNSRSFCHWLYCWPFFFSSSLFSLQNRPIDQRGQLMCQPETAEVPAQTTVLGRAPLATPPHSLRCDSRHINHQYITGGPRMALRRQRQLSSRFSSRAISGSAGGNGNSGGGRREAVAPISDRRRRRARAHHLLRVCIRRMEQYLSPPPLRTPPPPHPSRICPVLCQRLSLSAPLPLCLISRPLCQ